MAEQAQNTSLKTITVKDFMAEKGFVSVAPVVRENQNNYPYITFIDGQNVAENVYFSKQASAEVAAGTPIIRGFFDNFGVAETTNAAGETRMKLVSSSRLDISELF